MAGDQSRHALASVRLATSDCPALLALDKHGWGTVGGPVEEVDEQLTVTAADDVTDAG